METRITEIADGIYRLSTFVPDIAPPAASSSTSSWSLGEEPLLFHTGPRRMFPLVQAAVTRVMPPATLRWITFGHVEADECGAMNDWLAAASYAQVGGQTACFVSLNDLADRAPRMLENGTVLDIGRGKRLRYLDTPHVPHAWEAGVL